MFDLHLGDCREFLPSIPSASVDCVISDPPYPEISRDYGRMSEADWMAMMQEVVTQTRRILKPSGSAVFILQPNSEKVGKMRLWLWEFMVWCGKEWNIVQDAYWWNYTALPTGVCTPRERGLMRVSAKTCIWIGEPNCYRNQDKVLWSESEHNIANRTGARFHRQQHPSGNGVNHAQMAKVSMERGGATPFNVLPIANADSSTSAGAHGHGAGTPQALTDWWTRYLCPTGGVVADWFCGTGTTGLSAAKYGNSFVGCEKMSQYYDVSKKRLEEAYNAVQPALMEAA
jgi:site-specific DNA-methyltransferase (adenine-specific)